MRAHSPKLFGLDVLIDESGEPWIIEMQVKPAAASAPLVMRIDGELFATIFRMSMGYLIDDALPPERRAAIASDRAECAPREREIEEVQRGRFVPINPG